MKINKKKLKKELLEIFIGSPIILFISSLGSHKPIEWPYFIFVPVALCAIFVPIKVILGRYK